MRNPFLIARTVFFCILVYLNILAVGFAAWNVSAMRSAELSELGAPIFVIFNACTLFFFLLLAIAELASPCARTAQIGFECGWTAMLTILQLAAAIDVTTNGPPYYCSAQRLLAVCSSSAVLVPLTWASSTILMVYFLTIFVIAASHSSAYSGVWWTTVYTMPWFTNPPPPAKIHFPTEQTQPKAMPPKSPYQNPCFEAGEDAHILLTPPSVPFAQSYQMDLEKQNKPYSVRPRATSDPASIASQRPNWAKRVNTRRGVDLPFAPRPNTATRVSAAFKSLWPGAQPAPPPPKPSLPAPDNLGNGEFIDCVRSSYGHFPSDVENMDLPIARTHMKEWVKADRAVLAQ